MKINSIQTKPKDSAATKFRAFEAMNVLRSVLKKWFDFKMVLTESFFDWPLAGGGIS